MKSARSTSHPTLNPPTKPLTTPWIIRFLLALVVVLSLLAGYYQFAWQQEQKKYRRIEDMYVRVRDQLGREETQRLIDQSHTQQ